MAKILIFTAKWPFSNYEIDGGSITVSQYVSVLSQRHEVDYLYLKKNKDEVQCNVEGIHNLEVVDGEYLDYHTYNSVDSNKFIARLNNIKYNNQLIKERIDRYDIVLIVHCLQAMGLEAELTEAQLKKIIVLPMLLAGSYIKSGDMVPQEYIEAEKRILNAVGTIITPSTTERDYIVDSYSVESGKIQVIPRAVGREFIAEPHKVVTEPIDLCYVASFKNQKNNIDAIRLIHELKLRNISARLHLVGTRQDANVYQACTDYVNQNDLTKLVVFHEIMSQGDLASFYQNMDFNISTSLCETFGRSIFEGLAMGLPTIAYDCLEEVVHLTQRKPGIVFVSDWVQMADEIINLLNKSDYEEMSRQAIQIGEKFAYSTQERSINLTIDSILNTGK